MKLQLQRSISGGAGGGVFSGISSTRGIVLLCALVFSVGAGLGVSAWKAEPTQAVVNGKDATELGGQVQLRNGSRLQGITGNQASKPFCSGTLIDTKWVLTAKHCVSKNPFRSSYLTTVNGRVLVGERQTGEGESFKVKSIKKNSSTDTALLELNREASSEYVVGYGTGTPATSAMSATDDSQVYEGPGGQMVGPPGDYVQIRGWGETFRDRGRVPNTLQEATMEVNKIDGVSEEPGDGDTLELLDVGEGNTGYGDSGAGVSLDWIIYGVLSGGNDGVPVNLDYAVPTEDIAGWIKQTTGVEPSRDLKRQREKRREQRERDPRSPSRGGGSGGKIGAGGKVGAGAGGAIVADAIVDLVEVLEDEADNDEIAKEVWAEVSEQYPGYNVMVI